MNNVQTLPKLMTEKEAAKKLSISVPTIRRERGRERISFRRVGGSIKYTEADLIEYLDNGRVPCKTSSTPDKSENIGCHSEKDRMPGAERGSTSVHDRQGAHRLAQMTFGKPS